MSHYDVRNVYCVQFLAERRTSKNKLNNGLKSTNYARTMMRSKGRTNVDIFYRNVTKGMAMFP